MKVLFLDFDGVLNCDQLLRSTYEERQRLPFEGNEHLMFNPEAVALINRIVDATGAKVVLSTSWRIDGVEVCTGYLRHCGFTGEIIDRTPGGFRCHRGSQIRAWLNGHPEVTAFAILDDDDDMHGVEDRFVQTSWHRGMDETHAERVIALLNVEPVASVG